MDLQALVFQLRNQVAALQNEKTVFVNSEPKTPTTETVWVNTGGTLKVWDGQNWVIGGGISYDFSTTVVFTVADYNTVSWGTGTLSVGNSTGKTDYTIGSGSFDMSTITYFYWQSDIPGAIQTTTSASTAIIAGGLLVGVGKPNADTTKKAELQIFGGQG